MKKYPILDPNPVLDKLIEIITEIPINQIKSLENPLKESAKAPLGFPGFVTSVNATKAIATIEIAPIGKAFPMIAAIVPTNKANKCHAFGVTPLGIGIINQMDNVRAIDIKAGIGFIGVKMYFIVRFRF